MLVFLDKHGIVRSVVLTLQAKDGAQLHIRRALRLTLFAQTLRTLQSPKALAEIPIEKRRE